MATEHAEADSRRPAALDFAAALLLLLTVVLHVVAMVPAYFLGTGSLMSQADQAALYSVLAASWALALVIGLTGPHRTPVAAALAVGVAVTEFGFRVADFGDAVSGGTNTVGNGLWLMEAAWVVGAVAAAVAVMAARSRHRRQAGEQEAEPTEWSIDWTAPARAAAANPYGPEATHGEDPTAVLPAGDASTITMETAPAEEPTTPVPAAQGGDTSVLPIVPETDEDPHERLAWTVLVAVLAIVVAGAFLPAWDHAVAVSTQTGQTVTRSLGNAFTGPWQQVIGTLLVAVALLAVPIVAIRLKHKAIGAAAVVGGLLVLTSQFVSAVVQVDEPVPASVLGIPPAQAHALGLDLSLKLTGWFTVDVLAAYALFAAVMVWATLRVDHENSVGTRPSAPEWRSEAMPSAS